MTVSWTSEGPVRDPHVKYGTFEGGFGRSVAAETVTYVDGVSNRTVYIHHARLDGLHPDTFYTYAAMHTGARPDAGTFRTAPRGRRPITASSTPASAPRPPPTSWLVSSRSTRCSTSSTATSATPTSAPTGSPPGTKSGGGSTDPETAGLWYSFTAGSVHVVVLQNDDVALQDGGDHYVHGYSAGAQATWLEADLRRARADKDIDWIVVCMHQVMVSSADANGADLGVRQLWRPLFDRYGVDLVVCGHEHHYERSRAVRGVVSGSETLTPNPVSDTADSIDTSLGTVHMVVGGGGTSAPTNGKLFAPGQAKVLTGVGPVGSNGKRPPVYVFEQTPWSAFRDAEHAYGFAAFTVDPGRHAGDITRMHVTYYNVGQPDGSITPLESFVLNRKRADG